MKKTVLASLTLLASVIACLLFAQAAHAATFTVTSNADNPAVDPSVSCVTAQGETCTLRSSIEAANAQAGADTIAFDLTNDSKTITPTSALPEITEQVTIDGSTEPDASCGTLVPTSLPGSNTAHNLIVVVDGGSSGGSVTLHFADGSDNSTVRGLVLNNTTNFATALQIDSTVGGTLVECNYFGTNAAGDAPVPNTGVDIGAFINNGTSTIQNNLISGGLDGILASSATIQGNLIGTDATGLQAIGNSGHGIYTGSGNAVNIGNNVISGNTIDGINMGSGSDNHITNNYIGLNVAGSPLGNGGAGISAFGTSSFTIGSTLGRNVVSANSGDGVHIYSNCGTGSSIGSTTIHNYIGTNPSGNVQSGYGNGGAGMEVDEYQGSCGSVYNHKIGGDEVGQANIMAGNTGQGLLIFQSGAQDVFSITSLSNSIYANGQFGIDLASDSQGNGVADTDLGPNPLNNLAMEYPTTVANYYLNTLTVNSATYNNNQVTVNYNYQAPTVTDNPPYIQASNVVGYRLDFYLNDGQDGAYAGYSQGKTHLGSFIVNGSETNASHTFTSPVSLTNGQVITATATVLWQNIPDPGTNCQGDIWGAGPPYQTTCIQ